MGAAELNERTEASPRTRENFMIACWVKVEGEEVKRLKEGLDDLGLRRTTVKELEDRRG